MIDTIAIQRTLLFVMGMVLIGFIAVKAEAEQKVKDLQAQESGVQWR